MTTAMEDVLTDSSKSLYATQGAASETTPQLLTSYKLLHNPNYFQKEKFFFRRVWGIDDETNESVDALSEDLPESSHRKHDPFYKGVRLDIQREEYGDKQESRHIGAHSLFQCESFYGPAYLEHKTDTVVPSNDVKKKQIEVRPHEMTMFRQFEKDHSETVYEAYLYPNQTVDFMTYPTSAASGFAPYERFWDDPPLKTSWKTLSANRSYLQQPPHRVISDAIYVEGDQTEEDTKCRRMYPAFWDDTTKPLPFFETNVSTNSFDDALKYVSKLYEVDSLRATHILYPCTVDSKGVPQSRLTKNDFTAELKIRNLITGGLELCKVLDIVKLFDKKNVSWCYWDVKEKKHVPILKIYVSGNHDNQFHFQYCFTYGTLLKLCVGRNYTRDYPAKYYNQFEKQQVFTGATRHYGDLFYDRISRFVNILYEIYPRKSFDEEEIVDSLCLERNKIKEFIFRSPIGYFKPQERMERLIFAYNHQSSELTYQFLPIIFDCLVQTPDVIKQNVSQLGAFMFKVRQMEMLMSEKVAKADAGLKRHIITISLSIITTKPTSTTTVDDLPAFMLDEKTASLFHIHYNFYTHKDVDRVEVKFYPFAESLKFEVFGSWQGLAAIQRLFDVFCYQLESARYLSKNKVSEFKSYLMDGVSGKKIPKPWKGNFFKINSSLPINEQPQNRETFYKLLRLGNDFRNYFRDESYAKLLEINFFHARFKLNKAISNKIEEYNTGGLLKLDAMLVFRPVLTTVNNKRDKFKEVSSGSTEKHGHISLDAVDNKANADFFKISYNMSLLNWFKKKSHFIFIFDKVAYNDRESRAMYQLLPCSGIAADTLQYVNHRLEFSDTMKQLLRLNNASAKEVTGLPADMNLTQYLTGNTDKKLLKNPAQKPTREDFWTFPMSHSQDPLYKGNEGERKFNKGPFWIDALPILNKHSSVEWSRLFKLDSNVKRFNSQIKGAETHYSEDRTMSIDRFAVDQRVLKRDGKTDHRTFPTSGTMRNIQQPHIELVRGGTIQNSTVQITSPEMLKDSYSIDNTSYQLHGLINPVQYGDVNNRPLNETNNNLLATDLYWPEKRGMTLYQVSQSSNPQLFRDLRQSAFTLHFFTANGSRPQQYYPLNVIDDLIDKHSGKKLKNAPLRNVSCCVYHPIIPEWKIERSYVADFLASYLKTRRNAMTSATFSSELEMLVNLHNVYSPLQRVVHSTGLDDQILIKNPIEEFSYEDDEFYKLLREKFVSVKNGVETFNALVTSRKRKIGSQFVAFATSRDAFRLSCQIRFVSIPLNIENLKNDMIMHIVTDLRLTDDEKIFVDGDRFRSIVATINLITVQNLEKKMKENFVLVLSTSPSSSVRENSLGVHTFHIQQITDMKHFNLTFVNSDFEPLKFRQLPKVDKDKKPTGKYNVERVSVALDFFVTNNIKKLSM